MLFKKSETEKIMDYFKHDIFNDIRWRVYLDRVKSVKDKKYLAYTGREEDEAEFDDLHKLLKIRREDIADMIINKLIDYEDREIYGVTFTEDGYAKTIQ